MEGQAWWLLKIAPVSGLELLRGKFAAASVPFALLSTVLLLGRGDLAAASAPGRLALWLVRRGVAGHWGSWPSRPAPRALGAPRLGRPPAHDFGLGWSDSHSSAPCCSPPAPAACSACRCWRPPSCPTSSRWPGYLARFWRSLSRWPPAGARFASALPRSPASAKPDGRAGRALSAVVSATIRGALPASWAYLAAVSAGNGPHLTTSGNLATSRCR